MTDDTIRVLRVIEYVGLRSRVEDVVSKSVHGTKSLPGLEIRAATIGTYPEILFVEGESPSAWPSSVSKSMAYEYCTCGHLAHQHSDSSGHPCRIRICSCPCFAIKGYRP